ncbi:MAG: response regulator [Thermoguttaceae bacterium]
MPHQSDADKIHVLHCAANDLPNHRHLASHTEFPTQKVLVSSTIRIAEKIAQHLIYQGVATFKAAHPDLILLDLNLPMKDGREVLSEIKTDEHLRRIPVVVLTTSSAEQDILKTYDLHANCYITKPVDLEQFSAVVKAIEEFWLTIVKLPPE